LATAAAEQKWNGRALSFPSRFSDNIDKRGLNKNVKNDKYTIGGQQELRVERDEFSLSRFMAINRSFLFISAYLKRHYRDFMRKNVLDWRCVNVLQRREANQL
jgi:hypothetical protein